MIAIKDHKLNLSDIYDKIESVSSYYWKLLWIEGFAKGNFNMLKIKDIPKNNFNMLEFEDLVNKSPNGFFVDIDELVNVVKDFNQLTELVLVGDKSKAKLALINRNFEDVKQNYDFFIEYIDSWLWEITSKNKSFNENLKNINVN